MAIETKSPDSILELTNLSGAVSAIQDDPDSPDANWLTMVSNNADTVCRVSFPTPTGNPTVGVNVQRFKAWVRKADGTGTPSFRLEVYENGSLLETGGEIGITSGIGYLYQHVWNANLLVDPTGAGVECRAYGTKSGGSPSSRATVEVGAIEWNVDYTVGGTAVGDIVQGVWNIRQSISDTSQFVYSARAVLADTSQAVWNVAAAVGRVSQSIWNIRQAVGNTRQMIWDIRTTLGDTSQYVWNVLSSAAAVGDTIQLVWHLRQPISQAIQPVWNVRAVISDTCQAVWATLTSASGAVQSVWNIRRVAGQARQAVWNVSAAVGDTIGLVFNVLGDVLVAWKTIRALWKIGIRRIALDSSIKQPADYTIIQDDNSHYYLKTSVGQLLELGVSYE